VCCALFRLPSSEYVDDFTQVGLAADGKAGQWMTKVMHLLGWKVQEDPEKTQDFSTRFLALGVVFNCEGLGGGAFQVEDKPGRVEGVLAALDAAAQRGALPPPEAAALRGKLQYTRSQTFGRAGAPGLQALRRFEAGGQAGGAELAELAGFWRAHFQARRPRQLWIRARPPPLLLFTDGAVEPVGGVAVATIGGVLFDPTQRCTVEYFSGTVAAARVQAWHAAGTQHPVFQAELLPVVVAATTWRRALRGREVLVFVDNEAARYALVKGYSPVRSAAQLLGEAWLQLARSGAAAWFARVPSEGNPADAPSRGVQCPGWRRVSADVPPGLGTNEEWLAG